MTPSEYKIYDTINNKLMCIFLNNIWLAIGMGLLIWFWYTTQRLYYISLAGVDFLKFTRLIIYFVYLYYGDLETILNKDKRPMKLKYHNMDYLQEENLTIALFDTFYCINVICLIGYVGSFIYGIIYQIMEGAIGMIILTMMGSLIEIFCVLIKFEERKTRQIKIDKFKNLIKYKGIEICVICQEDFQVDEKIGQELEELQCTGKHMFHKNCINAWFIYNKTCPLCNYKILINIQK